MDQPLDALGDLYDGLPWWLQVLDWAALAVIVCFTIGLTVLCLTAVRHRRRERAVAETGAEDEFLFVFVVPALNEEVTIADSVSRLQQTSAPQAVIIVVDDGSQDRTGEILQQIDEPRLRVLTRRPPNARQGKAAALNDAYYYIRRQLLAEPAFARWPDDRVILVVVDADGRLHPGAPVSAARHFAEPTVGGLQVLVRIYNRRHALTWAQDVEFTAFGRIFQAGRAWWGTANLGGNGQFTRMRALADIDDGAGPWHHCLTEDQDLGVRLIQAGWSGVHANDVTIDQQGLRSLRRLYRQRVRWAQGNWQAMSLLGGVGRSRISPIARIDSVLYLLTPLLQLLVGVAFVASLTIWALGLAPQPLGTWWLVVLFVGLAFGPGVLTLLIRGDRWFSPILAVVLAVPYTVYSWLVFPVLLVSLGRQLAGNKSWAKTARESIEPEPAG